MNVKQKNIEKLAKYAFKNENKIAHRKKKIIEICPLCQLLTGLGIAVIVNALYNFRMGFSVTEFLRTHVCIGVLPLPLQLQNGDLNNRLVN